MSKEYKFIALQSPESKGVHFKADGGAGTIEGYAAVFAVIDEGGDIILPGAFTDTIEEYLKSGFTAHSHDWSVDGVIGYPVAAKEDEYGFYVESKFHSTPDAQAVRTKAQERMDAGKQVGLSIGYQLAEAARYIFPKDYEKELPKYLRAETLEENLEKAKRFSKIRLLSKLDNFEYSIVPAAMNKLARAVGVKSDKQAELKALFEDLIEENLQDPYYLFQIFMRGYWQIRRQMVLASETNGTFDEAGVSEFINEYAARLLSAILVPPGTSEHYGDYGYYGRSEALQKLLSIKSELVSDSPLDEHSQTVVSALKEFANITAALQEPLNTWLKRSMDKQEYRTKEGRTISQATASKIEAAKTQIDEALPALEVVSSALSDLLEMASPKEKMSSELARALRTQSLRLQSRAVGVPIGADA